MPKQKKTKPVKTVFRSYFNRQRLNRYVKNLYSAMPDMPRLMDKYRFIIHKLQPTILNTFRFKSVRFKDKMYIVNLNMLKPSRVKNNMRLVDLTTLNNTLAMNLTHKHRSINLAGNTSFTFEKINIEKMLKQQSTLLQNLIDEQRITLKKQAKDILEQEKAKTKKKFTAKQQ